MKQKSKNKKIKSVKIWYKIWTWTKKLPPLKAKNDVTCNSVEIRWTNEQKVAVTSYGRNKNDEIKTAGQVLTYNSKNFHWLNRKLDLERTMNGLEKPFRKKSDPKIEKTVKIKVKLPHVNKKPLARKRIFVQPPFSHSTLNLEQKIFTPQNHSLFRFLVSPWPKSLLQFDFKNHENVWTDLLILATKRVSVKAYQK